MIIKKVMPKIPVAKKRVAAYCRVSTFRNEQDESFETQQKYYEELIQSHPAWELVKVYADRHSATRVKNRPGFQEMAAAAEAKKLDIIICKSISRFSRNMVDCQQYAKWFRTLGVTIIFEEQNIRTDDPTCDFVLSILAAVAQDESHSISENETAKSIKIEFEHQGGESTLFQEGGKIMPAKTWQQNMLGITFRYADGRITVFRSALESIGRPEFYHFLYNPTKQMFAIQACGMDAEGANRVPKKNQDDRYEIKSKNLVRLLYQSCGWDRTRSYRLPGVEYPQQRLVNYDLCRAIPIFEGKVDKENESAQEPVQATSGAENI